MDATLLLALSAIVAASRPVRIPRLRVDVIPIHPFVLLALALHGGVAAALVGVAGIAGGAALRKPLPAAKRFVFNVVASVLSTLASAWTAQQLGGRPGASAAEWTWPLAAATLTYFAVGTGLVASAIAIEKHQGFVATWNRSLRWTALPYAMGFTVAVAALSAWEVSTAAGIALTVAPCWCLVLTYRAEALRQSA